MVSKLKFKGDQGSSKKKRKVKSADNTDSARTSKQPVDSEEIVGWTTARSEQDLYGPIMILLVSMTTPIVLYNARDFFRAYFPDSLGPRL